MLNHQLCAGVLSSAKELPLYEENVLQRQGTARWLEPMCSFAQKSLAVQQKFHLLSKMLLRFGVGCIGS
jgi:hypothetical protein